MVIKNITKKTDLSANEKLCDDAISKLIGLMFSQNKKRALIFKFRKEQVISLHMFFVFYPIDVVFLDKNRIVVDIKENFKPFTFYKSRKKALYAVELPNGSINESRTNIGDRIDF